MPSTPTTRLRVELQALGENTNTWGDTKLNQALQKIEDAICGVATIGLSGNVNLAVANYAPDAASKLVLKLTDAGLTAAPTLTAPSVEKLYLAVNCTAWPVTIKTATGAGVTIPAGRSWFVWCDGADFAPAIPRLDHVPAPGGAIDASAQRIANLAAPQQNADAATKLYVDSVAFTANAGVLPGQSGNGGKFLRSLGGVAQWDSAVDFKRGALGGLEGGAATLAYDAEGRVTTVGDTFEGAARTQTFTYDAQGRVATFATSYGGATRTETYSYDAATGRVSAVAVSEA
jgi:YD repeat-containing protein